MNVLGHRIKEMLKTGGVIEHPALKTLDND